MSIKKFLLVIISILSIITSYFTIYNYNYDLQIKYSSYIDAIGLMENKKTIPIFINITDNNLKKTNKILNKLYQYYFHKTFVITYEVPESNGKEKNVFGLHTVNQNILLDLSHRNANGLKFNNMTDLGYYSTSLNDNLSNDYIEIIDNREFDKYDEVVEIETLQRSIKKLSHTDHFAIYFYDNNVEEFEENFKIFLSSLNINISYENLIESYSPAQLQNITKNNFLQQLFFIGCVALIYILTLLIYFSSKRKIFLIQKMHGKSYFQLIKENILKSVIIHYIVFNMISYTLSYFISNKQLFYEIPLLKQMFLISLILFVLLNLVFIFIYILLHFTLSLKHLKSTSKNTMLMLIIKITVLVLFTNPILQNLNTTYKNLIDFYYISKYQNRISHLCYLNGDIDNLDENKKFFNHYINNKGIYCDFFSYYSFSYETIKQENKNMSDEEIRNISYDYPFIIVNTNYIESMNELIYNNKGQKIDLKSIKKDTILTPKKYKDKDFKKITDKSDIAIINIQDTGTFFNYYLDKIYTLSNPVIYIATEKNMGMYCNYLFIPYEKRIDEVSQEIKKITKEKTMLTSFDTILDIKKMNIKNALIKSLILTIMYIIIFISLIYQSIFWFIEEFQKSIIIKYLFGKNKKERYKNLIIINIIFYIFPMLLCLFFLETNIIYILKLYLFSILFEISIIYILIRKYEKKNIVSILKGESNL